MFCLSVTCVLSYETKDYYSDILIAHEKAVFFYRVAQKVSCCIVIDISRSKQ